MCGFSIRKSSVLQNAIKMVVVAILVTIRLAQKSD